MNVLKSAYKKTKHVAHDAYDEVKRNVKEQQEIQRETEKRNNAQNHQGVAIPHKKKHHGHHHKTNENTKKKNKKHAKKQLNRNDSAMYLQTSPSIRNNIGGSGTKKGGSDSDSDSDSDSSSSSSSAAAPKKKQASKSKIKSKSKSKSKSKGGKSKNGFFCAGCHNKKGGEELGFVHVLELQYHLQCLNCASCYDLIDVAKGDELSYIVDDTTGLPQPIHKRCYGDMLGVKCIICTNNIGTDPQTGAINFLFYNEFFGDQKMCYSHTTNLSKHQKPPRRCTSCYRYEPENEPFTALNDGDRVLCKACTRTVPMKKQDVKALYEQVLDFFEQDLELPLFDGMREIKIKTTKSDVIVREMCNCHITPPEDEGLARGLCLSAISDVVSGITKVTKILCLSGLPRDLTSATLAHEAVHAWIKLHPDGRLQSPLHPAVEEGACQLISYLFLQQGLTPINKQSETKSSRVKNKASPSDKQLRSYFEHSIQTDTDITYGGGFRTIFKLYQAMMKGDKYEHDITIVIPKLLNYIAKHRKLPSH